MRLLFYAGPFRLPSHGTSGRAPRRYPGNDRTCPRSHEIASVGAGPPFRGQGASFRGQTRTIRTGRADPAHRTPGKIICIHAVGLDCIRLLDAIYLCCKS